MRIKNATKRSLLLNTGYARDPEPSLTLILEPMHEYTINDDYNRMVLNDYEPKKKTGVTKCKNHK